MLVSCAVSKVFVSAVEVARDYSVIVTCAYCVYDFV